MQRSFLFLFLPFLLYGCSKHSSSYPSLHALLIVDTLVDNQPDSAMKLLLQLSDSIGREPEDIQMHYRLLSIKARDKAYLPHLSDSLIMQVVEYYHRLPDKKNLYAEALYYAGRVHSDLQQYPRALKEFLMAAEQADKKDYRLLRVIYSQIGNLYLRRGVSEKALEAHQLRYEYSLLTKNGRSIVYGLRDLVRTYGVINQSESAL